MCVFLFGLQAKFKSLQVSMWLPNKSFLGITPEKRISKDQASNEKTCFIVFLVKLALGKALMSIWLSLTLLLLSRHLQGLAQTIVKQKQLVH